MEGIIASQIVDWTGLNDPKENMQYYTRLCRHKQYRSTMVKGFEVRHNYNPEGKSHEFYVLDKEHFKVLYYCALTPSGERSIFKPNLHPYYEKLIWRARRGLVPNFAQHVFFKCIMPECKSFICSDEQQTIEGYWHWMRLICKALDLYYTVVLFAVDNKNDRRYIYLDEYDEDIMTADVRDFLTGDDLKFRHRGIMISVKDDIINSSVKAKEYTDIYEFLDD